MEIEIMTKFDKDFNQNLYDGIDVDKDKEKLSAYVNHFTEFRSQINKEANCINREV